MGLRRRRVFFYSFLSIPVAFARAGLGVEATELVIVQGVGRFGIGQGVNRDKGDDRKQSPADEAEVQHEELRLVSAHEPLALADALHDPHLGVVQQQVEGLAVAVAGDDAGNDEKQAPEKHKDTADDVKADDLEEVLKAVHEVPKAVGLASYHVEHEDDEAGVEQLEHEVEQQVYDVGKGPRPMREIGPDDYIRIAGIEHFC